MPRILKLMPKQFYLNGYVFVPASNLAFFKGTFKLLLYLYTQAKKKGDLKTSYQNKVRRLCE